MMDLRVAITRLSTWNHFHERVCVCTQVRSETVQWAVRRTNRPQMKLGGVVFLN